MLSNTCKLANCSRFGKLYSSLPARNYATATHISSSDKIQSSYDVVIVGGGHNGLVSAAYLAKQGLSVGVFERRHLIGGAAVTEEIVPGYKFSRASYVLSLLRPQVIKELELERHGLKVYNRTTSSFTPILEEPVQGKSPRSLMMSASLKEACDEIRKFSKKDALAYHQYETSMSKMATAVAPLLDTTLPNSNASFYNKIKSALPVIRAGKDLGSDMSLMYELITSPISKILNRWFESEPLKATLATDGVIGAMISCHAPGSGYVLLHHVIGECNGVSGSWGFVRGGMGAVSDAIASSAREAGADIFVSQKVNEIVINNDQVDGVLLNDGRHIKSKYVLSNATPHVTFNNLVKEGSISDREFMKHIESFEYTSPVTKINVAVDKLPNFLACPNQSENEVGPQHRGTIHLNCENMEFIHDAYLDAMQGNASKLPMIEMCIPSSIDDTLAPPNHHVISLFTQYTPYYLKGDQEWTDGDRQNYKDLIFSSIENYAPGFKDSVVGSEILTPCDLENIFGLTGGNIFHGAMSLDQLAIARPTSIYPSHETPVDGLYLCGSGSHPGGGVMGSCGRLAAVSLLNQRQSRKRKTIN